MNLYLSVNTTITDLVIDYIEVRLKSGEEVSLNWDESYIDRNESGFTAKYEDVCFGEKNASGKLEQLRDMKIIEVGLYTESREENTVTIEEMKFEDSGEWLCIAPPKIIVDWGDYLG